MVVEVVVEGALTGFPLASVELLTGGVTDWVAAVVVPVAPVVVPVAAVVVPVAPVVVPVAAVVVPVAPVVVPVAAVVPSKYS
jgi:hypothetical protein